MTSYLECSKSYERVRHIVTLSTILLVMVVSIVEVIWAVNARLVHHVVVEVIQLLNQVLVSIHNCLLCLV